MAQMILGPCDAISAEAHFLRPHVTGQPRHPRYFPSHLFLATCYTGYAAATWPVTGCKVPSVRRQAVQTSKQRVRAKRSSPGNRRYWFIRTNKEILAAKTAGDMRKLLQTFVKESRSLNSVNLATILYQGAKMDAAEVFSKESLALLARSLHEEELDARQLANALYGLQSMRDDTPGLADLLRALAAQVDRASTQERLSPQALGSGLYGLQGLSTDFSEVRRLLQALGRWLQQGCVRLTAQGVGMAFYGLQGMRLCPELEELLEALLPCVKASPLDGQAIGNALYGLQSLSSDSQVVRQLLVVFASKLKAFDCKMTEQEVSNALYGLQFMDLSITEVREIVDVLVTSVTSDDAEQSPSRDRRSQRSRHPLNPLASSESRLPSNFVAVAFPGTLSGERCRYLVDIGCDMGGFVRGVAQSRPEMRVVGLEMRSHAVTYAVARAREQGLQNAAFAQGNANVDLACLLRQVQDTGEVETVTVNFPDPHLLPEHRERRVLRGSLVKVLAEHLLPETEVLFQSDLALLVEEARAAFTVSRCFRATPWQSRQDLVDTERQKVVRRSGGTVHKARFTRCAVPVPKSLEKDVDRLLAKMRA